MQQPGGWGLLAEWWTPPAGDGCAAAGTLAGGGETVAEHLKAAAGDQRLAARRAAGVFESAGGAGKIAGVNIAEAGGRADFRGPEQRFTRRLRGAGHFEIRMEGRNVPGNIARDAGQEFGDGAQFGAGIVETPKAELKPAVPVKKSVTDDAIICLEDGKKFKSLKRHLQSVYGLSPEEYREKWGLTRDYPMVAPAYAAARSHLAKAIGLGRRPVEVAETPVKAAKATAKKSAAKAARK